MSAQTAEDRSAVVGVSDCRVVVSGARGRMGRQILEAAANAEGVAVVGALEYAEHPAIGQHDIMHSASGERYEILLAASLDAFAGSVDVLIDFSAPEATVGYVASAAKHGINMIVGTTNLGLDTQGLINKAAQDIGIVQAPNMSVGVNIMLALVAKAARTLGDEFDIEIFESHHRRKRDAPSGTAVGLGKAVAEAKGSSYEELKHFYGEGDIGPRPQGKIGMSVSRAGDIIGEHTVYFCSETERLEITHRAADRSLFAQGAVRAAKWLKGKSMGIYDMQDVLGLKS